MGFSNPPTPPAFVPPAPPPAVPPLSPTGARPQRKPMQPTMVGAALSPTAQQTADASRSLIGGAPTALGT